MKLEQKMEERAQLLKRLQFSVDIKDLKSFHCVESRPRNLPKQEQHFPWIKFIAKDGSNYVPLYFKEVVFCFSIIKWQLTNWNFIPGWNKRIYICPANVRHAETFSKRGQPDSFHWREGRGSATVCFTLVQQRSTYRFLLCKFLSSVVHVNRHLP